MGYKGKSMQFGVTIIIKKVVIAYGQNSALYSVHCNKPKLLAEALSQKYHYPHNGAMIGQCGISFFKEEWELVKDEFTDIPIEVLK